MKRDLMSLHDLSSDEILHILDLTQKIKNDKTMGKAILKDQSIGLVFQKPSNRTRVSFEVGVTQLGGHCLYLGPDEINLGVRESTADVSKTLSRYLNGIVARTHTHQDIEDLCRYSSVPVINGLSDLYHPCQALTDLFSIKEKFEQIKGLTFAYIGDGNNVCHSLLIGCAKVGIHINVATPKGYEPDEDVIETAKTYAEQSGVSIDLSNSPEEAVGQADVIYTDVWVSMGQEKESEKRLADFDNFQINEKLMQLANNKHIFMHCLPAHRGQEVTAEVIDGPNSIVFDQAENRLHTQKAVLMFLFQTQETCQTE